MTKTQKNVVWGAIVIASFALVFGGTWAVQKYWPKSTGRSSDPNKPNGVSIGLDPIDEMRTQAESYDIGREDGLEGRGIRILNREELRELADEGIRRYSRYVGDPKYREQQEEEDRRAMQQNVQQQPVPQPQPKPTVNKPVVKQPPTQVQKAAPAQQPPQKPAATLPATPPVGAAKK